LGTFRQGNRICAILVFAFDALLFSRVQLIRPRSFIAAEMPQACVSWLSFGGPERSSCC
jgi:hypothetical protein